MFEPSPSAEPCNFRSAQIVQQWSRSLPIGLAGRDTLAVWPYGTLALKIIRTRERSLTRLKCAAFRDDAVIGRISSECVHVGNPSFRLKNGCTQDDPVYSQKFELSFSVPSRPFALEPLRHLYSTFALTLSTESGAAIFHAQAYIPTQPAQASQEAWFSHAHEDPGRQKGDFPPPRQGTEAGFRKTWLPRVAFLVPLTSTVETFSRPPLHEGTVAYVALRNRHMEARPEKARPEIARHHFAMPPEKTARFPRAARLLRHADFERVYKQGRRHFSASMTVFYWPRPETTTQTEASPRTLAPAPTGLRVGFTMGRALGGAVQRNRMKRRLREAVRMTLPAEAIAADVVINPKKSLLTIDFAAVRNEVTRAFAVIEQKLSRTLSEKAPEATNRIAGSPKPLRLRSGQAPPESRS